MAKQYESGHPKILESSGKLIAIDETLDKARLSPPAELKLSALKAKRDAGTIFQTGIGNSRADWRTSALDRAADIDKFDSVAAEAVALFEGRGAGKESVEDARSYVRKLQGRKLGAVKPAKNKNGNPILDESEKGISAAKISTMYELIDFLEAQPKYAEVTKSGFIAAELRAFVDATQAKHDASLNSVAKLANDRRERNKFFYLNDDCVCELARQFKALIGGAYGFKSPEYKAVNSIPFKKPKL
ncbi:MAG: hypothetical protein WA584_14080 [Pyrinomonadaceae bacterium]